MTPIFPPINLTKDSAWLAEKGARILVEGAIKSYSSRLNTNSPNQATIDNIVKGITLPVNVLNDAMQIYNQAGRWLTIEQVKNIVSRFFSDKIDKGEITIPKIENPGQSTTTFAELSEAEKEKLKAEAKKAVEIVEDALKTAGDITSQAGQSVAEKLVKDALQKAGYTSAATTLSWALLADALLGGAFNAKAFGDPTDVKGLLRRQGEEFIKEEQAKLMQQGSGKDIVTYTWNQQQSLLIEELTKNAMDNYLDKINYASHYPDDFKNRLVFPETKFEFKYIDGKITIEQKK